MKNYFPFTDYDFWAYFTAGFVLLFAGDYAFRLGMLSQSNWTIFEGVLAVALAYIVGQLVAEIASAVLERRVVARKLGKPSVILLGVTAGPRWFRWLYASFYQPLPETTRQKILAKAANNDIDKPGEALFWLAFENARQSDKTMERMTSFLNQYGMCRNLCTAGLLSTILLAVGAYWRDDVGDLCWAALVFLGSVGMFFRYLKFYRHYSVELLTHFAHSGK